MIIIVIKKIIDSRVFNYIIGLLLLLLALDQLFPLPPMKPYSKVILSKDGTMLTAYLSKDDKWRMETPLNEVSPDLIKAIIEKEDSWYYYHFGVNPIAIVRAFYSNMTSGKIVSGASTITMQVARLLEPADRTYMNKFLEAIRAVQLEFHYSKKQILEMYLSLLPFGGNIEGVKAASYIYFNRPPSRLSLAQSILLAEIPNNPNKYRLDRNVDDAIAARNSRIKKFIEDKVFPLKNLQDAMDEPLSSNRYSVQSKAPHFCNFVNSTFHGSIIKTTLDLNIQQKAENLLTNYIRRVKLQGVSNGAVLIIRNSDCSVVGYCGSADFNNFIDMGQVNGITAVRSPGSTLKPLLYCDAFNKGILTPKMKLLDIPTDFSGYSPENYDLKYNGDVTAKFALLASLNVPAVRLLHDVGMNEFLNLLESCGFDEIQEQRNKLGLSAILGGCGVTLEELTRAYTVFAKQGKLYPLKFLADKKNNKFKKIFSNGAVYILGDILSNNKRPDFENSLIDRSTLPIIAWKTGTSYGKRDAWAIGFSPKFTIGVWMGNFDGTGSPFLSGAEMAVPLLFDLFNSIDYNPRNKWFEKPKSVLTRTVCSETGLLPSQYCTHTTTDYYIKNVSSNKYCDLYKEIYVSNDEKIEYCSDCLPKTGYKKKAYPFYDPELKLWFEENNIAYTKVPPHNPECKRIFSSGGPKIISPSPNYKYYIEENSKQQILLQAATESGVKEQYWYINDRFYKKTKPGENIFYQPSKKELKISCLDDKGRSETVKINVFYY